MKQMINCCGRRPATALPANDLPSLSTDQMVLARHSVMFVSLILALLLSCADSCTVFLVGKDATLDGSVLVSHSNDGEFETDPRLVHIPAQQDIQQSRRPVFDSPENYPRYVGTARGVPEYYPRDNQTEFQPLGYIPQVDSTFSYLEETYGALNDQQLGIGESTCSAVFGASNDNALFSIDALTQIAMERTSTARDAIQIMGKLAEEHGFYGAGQFEGTGESLGVTDTQEAWIFHILPDPTGTSAIWAAQRIPSNSFAVLANMFVIRQVDPDDKDNFLMSQSVFTVAEEYGWWDSSDGQLLDFTKVYSDGEYAHKYYSGRRVWGGYHLAAPSQHFAEDYSDLQSDPVYPVYIIPDYKLSVTDLFRFHRYTYQGTKYDLGAVGNMAAGPFGSPDRWKAGPGEQQVSGNWERPIGLYRTSDTYVVQSRYSSSMSGVLWFGPASALGTIFTPFVVGMEIPASFRSGHHAVFSRESAFWAACFVHNVANLKWSYAITDVEELQWELEQGSVELVDRLEREIQHNSDHDLTNVHEPLLNNAKLVVSKLWSLSDTILFKYASGFVNEPPNGMSQMVGYPAWWLQAVGFENGPPPPPTEPKCCHPQKQTDMTGGLGLRTVTTA